MTKSKAVRPTVRPKVAPPATGIPDGELIRTTMMPAELWRTQGIRVSHRELRRAIENGLIECFLIGGVWHGLVDHLPAIAARFRGNRRGQPRPDAGTAEGRHAA